MNPYCGVPPTGLRRRGIGAASRSRVPVSSRYGHEIESAAIQSRVSVSSHCPAGAEGQWGRIGRAGGGGGGRTSPGTRTPGLHNLKESGRDDGLGCRALARLSEAQEARLHAAIPYSDSVVGLAQARLLSPAVPAKRRPVRPKRRTGRAPPDPDPAAAASRRSDSESTFATPSAGRLGGPCRTLCEDPRGQTTPGPQISHDFPSLYGPASMPARPGGPVQPESPLKPQDLPCGPSQTLQ